MEKISIITPSLNQKEYIEKTILSVREQNYPNYEHIIIDGKSTDGTLDILKKFKNEITYISEKDTGQANAINKGLRMASGDILAFINSDDYYLPNTFNSIISAFQNHSAGWLIGDYKIIDSLGNEIHNFVIKYKKTLREMDKIKLFYLANYIPQPSTFWKRNFFIASGYFNEKYTYAFDYEYWLRLYKIETPIIIRNELSAFRIHQSSKGSQDYELQLDEEIRILKEQRVDKFFIALHTINNGLIKLVYKFIK
jgi:glycosyltransferase involved in cell wall biosynthesis